VARTNYQYEKRAKELAKKKKKEEKLRRRQENTARTGETASPEAGQESQEPSGSPTPET
jgi:hypothetical protein